MIDDCDMILKFLPKSQWRTLISHLKSLNLKKNAADDVGILGPGLGQTQKCGRVSFCYCVVFYTYTLLKGPGGSMS